MGKKIPAVNLAAIAAASVILFAAPAGAQTNIIVRIAPPAPQVEAVPAARPGHEWVPGHWQWRPALNQYVWVKGRYVSVRSGYVYVRPRWVQVNGQWQYRVGGWIPKAAYARGVRDIDRDGIPDRWDADRDGDGIANRYDASPAIVTRVAPPPLRSEAAPPPRPGQVWSPGHWQWRPALNQYVWVQGRYVSERPGYVYIRPRWVQVNGRWEYRTGGWVTQAAYRRGVRDIDRDGIPDRWDADRDNDGVANRNDRAPANPTR